MPYQVRHHPPLLPPPPPPLILQPPFPVHAAVAVFAGNFTITLLSFLALLQGIDGLPNLHPPSMRKIVIYLASTLLGSFFLIHLFTPVGLLPGPIGIAVPFLLFALLGSVPLLAFPTFREILHDTPQPWLMGLHTVRCMGYLLLTLFDMGYLPAAYAIPVGWGDTMAGISAPIMAHAFATGTGHAKELGLGWNAVCLAEIVMSLACGGAFLDKFIAERVAQRLPIRYLWYTVLLIPRYTLPFLSLMHGFSIWKLLTEKEAPAMIWQEGDVETESIYDMDGAENP